MGWYLGVVKIIHNNGFIIYIFTGEVNYGTPNIFINKNYNTWLQKLSDQFSPIIINTTYDHVYLLNQVY